MQPVGAGAVDAPAEPESERPPAGAGLRVAALIAVMAAAAFAVTSFLVGEPPLADALGLPWWSVALLFAVTSRVQMHVEVRRSAHSVTATDLAVVIALFSGAPMWVPVLRAATWIPTCAWRYRNSLRRAVFNAVLGPLETAIAALLFVRIADGVLLGDPRSWAGAYVGVIVAGFIGVLLVTAVIALNDGTLSTRSMREAAALGALVAAANCTLGIIAVILVDSSPAARWLLIALAAVLVVLYQSYATLRERHHGLESLFGFTRSLSRRTDAEDAVPTLLRLAADRLSADYAELLLAAWPGEDGPVLLRVENNRVVVRPIRLEDHWPLARVLSEQTPMILNGARSSDVAAKRYLDRVGRREMLLAPLPSEDAPAGVLVVCDRTAASVRGFTDDDLRLLETMATHGAAAIANARLVDRLRHDANHDALTGLRKRSVLPEAVGALVTPAAENGTCVGAVALLDLDDFKQVNDALGHHVGDLLLQQIATRLKRLTPAGSHVCRLGGDEFALVLAGDDPHDLLERVAVLKEELARPLDLGPVTVSTSASVGVSFIGPHGVSAPLLLQRADVAMYAAKRTNRGVVPFDNSIDSVRPERLGLASDLRALLKGDEGRGNLEVHYQPQVSSTGTVVAIEALVRWAHPTMGLLAPDEFVPVAESTGQAGRLTNAVLRTALADLRTFDSAGHRLAMSVNLSARSLHDPHLVEDVALALATHGVSAGRLTLELTESSIVSDPVRASELLGMLSQNGVRVSVDDFGTGFSSLSHLARLPVSEIKVDKSFVRRMRQDARDAAIVRSVVRLAAELEMAVVAEGVEDERTAAELLALGCDLLQGYLFSRPVPAHVLLDWLKERPLLQAV
ncbi:MAG TPA: EAL domain-containing protein [Frankiaceae bacterium]|nr:EAL domain-containing protein [Frankiaceae bacterium]